jgi:hypothetical protein
MEEPRPTSRLRRWLVTGFIAFHVVAIPAFAVPLDVWPEKEFRELVTPYMLCIGMNETWDTFAPRPKSSEQYLKAVVETESGDTRVYSFPRMESLSWSGRYQRERYRKFVESSLCKECSGLWPDIEKKVASQVGTTNDLVRKVILIEFESTIDPATGSTGAEGEARPTVLTELFLQPEESR